MKNIKFVIDKLEKANKIKYYSKITAIILIAYLSFAIYRIITLSDSNYAEHKAYEIKSQLSINFK